MSRVVHTNIWSAYGYARKAGYEGTEEEFEQGLKKSAEAAGNAEESASTASEAATEANAARDAAAQSAESASTSEGNALEYANSAAQVLRDAQAVAQTVNAKATEAAGSASRAENYAQTATTKASEAATAAGTATTAATSASGSAQAADASATAAAASETNAAASASSASTSAGSASESADDAAESAAAAQAVKDSIPADYSQLSADVTDLKSQITQECIELSSSDFTKGTWSGGAISPTNNCICVKKLIPVKAGDKMTFIVASGLMIAFGTYEPGATASTDYHTWAATASPQEYVFPVDGHAFVQIKKASEANISPSEYDGTVKIYNTIYKDVVDVKTGLKTVNDKIYYTEQKSVTYITGLINTGGNFASRSSCKVTNVIPLESGQTIKVKTKGDGSYVMTVIAKMATADAPISVGQSGGTTLKTQISTSLMEYTYTATDELEYIVCSVKVDDTSVITFENTEKLVTDKLQQEIDGIASTRTPLITNKYIMLFGDSLTAASTSGVVGFGKIIANDADLPYKAFVYDSADGSASDIPQTSPCVLNYAKDGTTNRIISGRTDSVVERVKRHIVGSTNIDYVLIECCVNDAAQSLANKGTISASYTATFDTETTLGALEETIRYITTLGKPIKVGFFIPWQVSWVPDSWFDDYIAVFEKWAVPVLDLRKAVGFDVKHCTAQSNIYTLTADSYPAYSNTATYNLDDKVKYGGMLYKCIQNNVSGILPTNDEYWMEVSSSASDGTHLNTLGHAVVVGKIQDFLQRL